MKALGAITDPKDIANVKYVNEVYHVWKADATYAADAWVAHNGYLWRNTSGAASTGVEPGTNYNVWNVNYSNRNLLDNPFFTVNQRGVTSFSVGAYGVDRWKLISGSAAVTENGIQLNGTLRQIIKNAVNKSVTANVKMYSGTATVTYDDTTKYCDIVSSGGVVRAAKLEVGAVNTLANDTVPDYGAESVKCVTSTADPDDTYANKTLLTT